MESSGPAVLAFDEVRDRAQVFLNRVPGHPVTGPKNSLVLPANAGGTLEILVEDQGRVNYGPRLGEPKGLIGGAGINGEAVLDWELLPLDFTDISRVSKALLNAGQEPLGLLGGPAFARATFDVPQATDLFLDIGAWGKGIVWVNGFCLGRYWSRGPQRTLYVPGPLLRSGPNELIVLELQSVVRPVVSFVSAPDLGHTEF